MASCRSGVVQVVLLVTALCATASPHGRHGGDEVASSHWNALRAISHSNLDFTNELYKVLSRNDGNVFFSPFSIQVILALTSQGARGTTLQQMVAGLQLPEDQQTTRDGFHQLINSIHGDTNVTLKCANKIYTDAHFTTNQEFSQIATKDFHSGSQTVDFANKPDESRVTINSWVAENTNNKITDLLKEGVIKTSTAMVLVNAVYFKGNWHTKFDVNKTANKPFHISADVTKDVPMMQLRVEGEFGYKDSEELNAQILEIPYVGHKMSLYIILPKERNGLHDVETRMAGLKFSNVTSRHMTHPEVHLTLPKFKLEQEYNLNDVLQGMGMTQMFTDNADFSGLVSGPAPTKVSKVAHKSFIEVNEEGTEAAASTAVVQVTRSHRVLPQITFNANHPFIFILVNTETNAADRHLKEKAVLFMGRYSKP